jgi:hypothetical protein
MNNYITLDTYKYKTLQRAWVPSRNTPSTSRVTLLGDLDITFGHVTLLTYQGELVGPVSVADTSKYPGGGWGTITELRASLGKKQALAFTDHEGLTMNVHARGPYPERNLLPDWDNTNNLVYVMVTLVGKPS